MDEAVYREMYEIEDRFWWFAAKLLVMLYVFIWIRVTVPRLRYDRAMAFCWKVLVPLAVGNVLVTALGLVLRDMHLFGL